MKIFRKLIKRLFILSPIIVTATMWIMVFASDNNDNNDNNGRNMRGKT